MKKIFPILTLVVGIGIGWSISSYQSRQAMDKIQKAWSPEFQQFVKDSYALGSTMTEEELREQLESVVEVGKKMSTDGNSRTLWQAQQSLLIKKYLENGNTNSVNSSIQSRLDHFVQRYDQGDFKDDINEEFATKLVEAIKNANQSSEVVRQGNN
ncbi:hypothetical protein [Pontiella desulfatans]|uniref:hypothetical protein n=1 Tax=Pontiella desulfatans TaxID=2750659 RepID=UPI00109BF958|nr:hypothetical protein [Pontiella desulfatans]